MATVCALNVRTADKKRRTLSEAALIANKGFALDSRGGGDRQVSLMSAEAMEQAKELNGLCTGKFAANIVTKDLNYSSLRAGDILCIGECAIEITGVGKPCYEQCALHQSGSACPLPSACAFGRVKRGGRISTGMPLEHGTW